MKSLALIFLILGLCVLGLPQSSRDRNDKPYKVVCYWGSWSNYSPGDGKFNPEDIDPKVCTHLMYAFAKLNSDNTIGVFDDYLDVGDEESGGLGGYRRFNAVRKLNPHLTTFISIGGWNEGSIKYSAMASDAAKRKKFIDSVLKFLKKHDFDGLDVDWEYPGFKNEGERGGNPADKQHYAELLKELRAAFNPHGYLLTAAVSAGKPTIDIAYDVPSISQSLDFINLMCYDYHGEWDPVTGVNAPLHSKANDSELDKEFTVEYSVDYWIKKGADPKKLILGMPLYGRSFTLSSTNKGLKAPSSGAGLKGPFTDEAGLLGYNEICLYLKNEKGEWHITRDDDYRVPYAVKGNQWVGYDDIQSIKEKVDFLKSRKLGGGMVWSIENDDFRGKCGDGSYPLLKTIMSQLNGGPGPNPNETHNTLPTQHPTHPTHPTVTGHTGHTGTHPTKPNGQTVPTQKPGEPFKCTSSGFFPDPKDRHTYHECVDAGDGKFTDFSFKCGPGTVYDPVNHVCKLE